jgi:hypothetical protein
VSSCRLERLEGNGILLSGFNQNTTITRNHIAYTGDTALGAWGYSSGTDPNQPEGTGPDGTGGEFPRWTQVTDNFIHHLGVHEKQSSCWFQVKTLLPHPYCSLIFIVRHFFSFDKITSLRTIGAAASSY